MSSLCSNISFYHTQSPEYLAALFMLLKKTLTEKKRAFVLFEEEDMLDKADKFLWEGHSSDFLPHGKIKDPLPEKQPIFLANTLYNANQATYLFLTPQVNIQPDNTYERCFILFSEQQEEDVKWARGLWSFFKAERQKPKYWSQDNTGKWSLKQ